MIDVITPFCESHGMPVPVREYRFARPRRFRFDWAWLRLKLALEVDGGIYGRGKPCPLCGRRDPGAHSSIEQMKKDRKKDRLAVVRGWRVVRFLPEEIDSGEVFRWLESALAHEACP